MLEKQRFGQDRLISCRNFDIDALQIVGAASDTIFGSNWTAYFEKVRDFLLIDLKLLVEVIFRYGLPTWILLLWWLLHKLIFIIRRDTDWNGGLMVLFIFSNTRFRLVSGQSTARCCILLVWRSCSWNVPTCRREIPTDSGCIWSSFCCRS